MRKKIVAANWKMNLSFDQADELLYQLQDELVEKGMKADEIVLCPSFPYLELAGDNCESMPGVFLGAQNVAAYENGAYTGEVSAEMLASLGVEYCIIGHSERRNIYQETDEVIVEKAKLLLDNGIKPIFCCGESLEEREKNIHFDKIKKQINALISILKEEILNVVIAYEPIWAIGTGKTASPEQAQEMHAFIRSYIKENFDDAIAQEITILYGGSCKAANAQEIFAKDDVDGGLIGGASLKVDEFIHIVNAY